MAAPVPLHSGDVKPFLLNHATVQTLVRLTGPWNCNPFLLSPLVYIVQLPGLASKVSILH